MKPVHALSLDQINLSDIDFWTRPLAEREGAFATLRAKDPLPFFPEPVIDIPGIVAGRGYHAVTKFDDILEVSKNPQLYCSGFGAPSIQDTGAEFNEFFGSMINMDDPRHARLRKIVASGFTPRMLKKVEDDVQRAAQEIVDDLLKTGGGDFVTDVAARLPLKVICDMMGIPEADYETVFKCSNVILGAGDSEYVDQTDPNQIIHSILQAGGDLHGMVTELGKYRREHPTDDLTSALVNAEVDGERLTDQELGSFFILLVVAGNETTRNAISHGLHLLTQNPEQRAILAADFYAVSATAVEEIVRVASPVIFMRRTATADAVLRGRAINQGDKLVMFYWSANRDEAVFPDPYRFDVRRTPNPHVGFGGPGPHFCLGAHLARREITVMFRELFARVPNIATPGEPERLRSMFINGIKHLDCEIAA